MAVKGCCGTNRDESADDASALVCDELTTLAIDPHKDELEVLQEHESLAEIRSKCISKRDHLVSIKVVSPYIISIKTITVNGISRGVRKPA